MLIREIRVIQVWGALQLSGATFVEPTYIGIARRRVTLACSLEKAGSPFFCLRMAIAKGKNGDGAAMRNLRHVENFPLAPDRKSVV